MMVVLMLWKLIKIYIHMVTTHTHFYVNQEAFEELLSRNIPNLLFQLALGRSSNNVLSLPKSSCRISEKNDILSEILFLQAENRR